MDEGLRLFVRPALRDPALVLAFDGWNDAGESATTATRYLAEAIGGVPLAEIDPEEFFDFTVRRPQLVLEQGMLRRIHWPVTEFRYGTFGADRELVTGLGPEPHLRWRRFCDHVLDLVRITGVRKVALLGAYMAEVLYSRPVRVTGFASDPERMTQLGVEPSGYEGATGIIGVLGERLREEKVDVVSLWAGLPHYVSATPNPRGALALIQKLSEYLEIRVDQGPLTRAAAEFEQRISAQIAADPALSEYVRELKRREFAQ